ncbi:hypothetical protein EIN_201720 [Entamoeba invadens IP1]|uniref:Uncharacterized protein n=1 Tax=Entamoeba invadens IP1 TaxID=370355 RepID=A0A0A1U923_ENTIV|nr:hypothetical protein EIN_201720 [Entamoeba invadens IP1]ELP89637.1 hypothetical protein EIN_201720 [Entamoeba invadens IP1]|eukprot:XP_004256408.1 hypothetical protein EIN_201720 [Entamoeba invadens IP1]
MTSSERTRRTEREYLYFHCSSYQKGVGNIREQSNNNIIIASYKRSGVVGVNIGKIKRMFVSIKEASRLLQEANGVYTREHLESFVIPPRPTYLVKSEEESLPRNIQELNQQREPYQTRRLTPTDDIIEN